jgi:hypothetical protein
MPVELFVRRRHDAPALCATELREKLVTASGLSCRVEQNDVQVKLVLGESDVVASLQVDVDGTPEAGVVEFSLGTALRNVSSVCRTFRQSGWDLGDVP